jgi:hypothetical protein
VFPVLFSDPAAARFRFGPFGLGAVFTGCLGAFFFGHCCFSISWPIRREKGSPFWQRAFFVSAEFSGLIAL